MKKILLWLASFRLRILFRTAFLLLALFVVALVVTVLQGEKQRGYNTYQASFTKTKDQIAARLRHPSGQLALLNPFRQTGPGASLHPVLLPFSAIDFDDQTKVRNAVEMADCLIQYRHHGSLCVAIGNNPWAGGFIYAAGTFASNDLVAHRIGDQFLDGSHRLQVSLSLRGETYRWIAPFEPLPNKSGQAGEGVRGRFTGYMEQDDRDYTGARTVKEFRGWVWQDSKCLNEVEEGQENCEKKSFFSIRLPVQALASELFRSKKPVWPPADLNSMHLHLKILPPDDSPPLFDSSEAGAIAPFSLADLQSLLLPGETLEIRKTGEEQSLLQLKGRDEDMEQTSPLLAQLIRKLPVEHYDTPLELATDITTPLGSYSILLKGDARSLNKNLSVVATRLSWFVAAMLLAIVIAWVVIEVGIIHRIAILTKRSSDLSRTEKTAEGLAAFDLSDLKGNDELGILASCLNDLLRRVKEDFSREKIRTEQEKDMWHAVGHEIMSPLQSLLALHSTPDDPSRRYLSRMQQAVQVLYGRASPSEAFASSTLALESLDIDDFLQNVAANAACIGIEEVIYESAGQALQVRAEAYSLEDVVSHILSNANRYRLPDTPIRIRLEPRDNLVQVSIYNQGPTIPAELLDKIFEYGVSGPQDIASNGNRGQGLFVAKTYMAKMGGTISVRNEPEGVCFVLNLQRAEYSTRR